MFIRINKSSGCDGSFNQRGNSGLLDIGQHLDDYLEENVESCRELAASPYPRCLVLGWLSIGSDVLFALFFDSFRLTFISGSHIHFVAFNFS